MAPQLTEQLRGQVAPNTVAKRLAQSAATSGTRRDAVGRKKKGGGMFACCSAPTEEGRPRPRPTNGPQEGASVADKEGRLPLHQAVAKQAGAEVVKLLDRKSVV